MGRSQAHPEAEGRFERAVAVAEGDLIRVAMDAAGIGTWEWHIASGRSAWTPRTYALFGVEPGAFVPTHEEFLQRVYAPDRLAVLSWISQALRDGRRTALEFRIEGADGVVRWVRSVGRALADEHGKPVGMAGVVQDITEEKRVPSEPAAPEPRPMAGSFCARQVAHILGLSEASVKRLASGGALTFLQSSRRNSRRFAPNDVAEYLRRFAAPARDFEARVRAGDVDGCALDLLESLLAGEPLEDVLDLRVAPVLGFARPDFASELLRRVPFMLPERPRAIWPALICRVGPPLPGWEELVACFLRANGYEVLRPAGNPDPMQLGEVADRVRARAVIFSAAAGAALAHAVDAADALASRHGGSVYVGCGEGTAPSGLATCFSSMRELAALLKRAAASGDSRR